MQGSHCRQMKGANGETGQGVTVGYQLEPLDPKRLGFMIWLGFPLHQFQKNWLLSMLDIYEGIIIYNSKTCTCKRDNAETCNLFILHFSNLSSKVKCTYVPGFQIKEFSSREISCININIITVAKRARERGQKMTIFAYFQHFQKGIQKSQLGNQQVNGPNRRFHLPKCLKLGSEVFYFYCNR